MKRGSEGIIIFHWKSLIMVTAGLWLLALDFLKFPLAWGTSCWTNNSLHLEHLILHRALFQVLHNY